MSGRHRSLVLPALLALALLACTRDSAHQAVDLSFPAAQLRLDLPVAAIGLSDHRGAAFSLEAQEGRVVLITSVYTTCPKACPSLLAQTRNAVEALSPEQRQGLRVAAITMDPVNDTQERLATLAGGLSVQSPPFHFLGGEPEQVESTLDALGFKRDRDPETGIIDHAPIVLLVDRGGRLAYRLSLVDPEGTWLPQALEVLLAE